MWSICSTQFSVKWAQVQRFTAKMSNVWVQTTVKWSWRAMEKQILFYFLFQSGYRCCTCLSPVYRSTVVSSVTTPVSDIHTKPTPYRQNSSSCSALGPLLLLWVLLWDIFYYCEYCFWASFIIVSIALWYLLSELYAYLQVQVCIELPSHRVPTGALCGGYVWYLRIEVLIIFNASNLEVRESGGVEPHRAPFAQSSLIELPSHRAPNGALCAPTGPHRAPSA